MPLPPCLTILQWLPLVLKIEPQLLGLPFPIHTLLSWPSSHPATPYSRLSLHLLLAVNSWPQLLSLVQAVLANPEAPSSSSLPNSFSSFKPQPMCPLYHFQCWHLYLLSFFYCSVSPIVYQFYSFFQKITLALLSVNILFFVSVFSAFVFYYFLCLHFVLISWDEHVVHWVFSAYIFS